MNSSRMLVRTSLRPVSRTTLPLRSSRVRFQSTTESATKSAQHAATSPITIALSAGAVGGFVAYGVWYLSPAGKMSRSVHKAASQAHSYYQEAGKTLQQKTPSTDQAINAIRTYANSYVAWIPGGQSMVDSAFNELDKVREKHGKEVDDIVRTSYEELQQASKGGLSMDTAKQFVDAFKKLQRRLVGLAQENFNLSEILENHPTLQHTVGQPIQQLKQMGDTMGPQVKEEVDKTWDQLKQIMAGGISATTLSKAKDLIQEKTEKLKGMGDELWKQGLEKAKPVLDKNPKVKQLLEQNADALKQGNIGELVQKLTSAAQSGNTGDLENYVKDATEKAKNKGSSLGASFGGFGAFEQYAKMIPGGDQIVPKLSQLKEVADKHRDEGEHLLRETIDEIRKVMDKQGEKAKHILEKASSNAK